MFIFFFWIMMSMVGATQDVPPPPDVPAPQETPPQAAQSAPTTDAPTAPAMGPPTKPVEAAPTEPALSNDEKKRLMVASYLETKEYKKAFDLLARIKTTTDPEVWFALGRMFEEGWGTKTDYKQSRAYYGKAAKAGHAASWGRLGILVFEGLGGVSDKKAAAQLFQKGCEAKDHLSCWRLALLKDTEGLDPKAPTDPELAVYLFEKGDYDTAIPALQKHSNRPETMNALAKAYHFGWGVKKDFEQAKTYYENTLKYKYGPAALGLGRMYHAGEGVPKDSVLADYYYELACGFGDKMGCKQRYSK